MEGGNSEPVKSRRREDGRPLSTPAIHRVDMNSPYYHRRVNFNLYDDNQDQVIMPIQEMYRNTDERVAKESSRKRKPATISNESDAVSSSFSSPYSLQNNLKNEYLKTLIQEKEEYQEKMRRTRERMQSRNVQIDYFSSPRSTDLSSIKRKGTQKEKEFEEDEIDESPQNDEAEEKLEIGWFSLLSRDLLSTFLLEYLSPKQRSKLFFTCKDFNCFLEIPKKYRRWWKTIHKRALQRENCPFNVIRSHGSSSSAFCTKSDLKYLGDKNENTVSISMWKFIFKFIYGEYTCPGVLKVLLENENYRVLAELISSGFLDVNSKIMRVEFLIKSKVIKRENEEENSESEDSPMSSRMRLRFIRMNKKPMTSFPNLEWTVSQFPDLFDLNSVLLKIIKEYCKITLFSIPQSAEYFDIFNDRSGYVDDLIDMHSDRFDDLHPKSPREIIQHLEKSSQYTATSEKVKRRSRNSSSSGSSCHSSGSGSGSLSDSSNDDESSKDNNSAEEKNPPSPIKSSYSILRSIKAKEINVKDESPFYFIDALLRSGADPNHNNGRIFKQMAIFHRSFNFNNYIPIFKLLVKYGGKPEDYLEMSQEESVESSEPKLTPLTLDDLNELRIYLKEMTVDDILLDKNFVIPVKLQFKLQLWLSGPEISIK